MPFKGCLILGCGPSLRAIQKPHLRDYITFGANHIDLANYFPDYHCAADGSFFLRRGNQILLNGAKWIIPNDIYNMMPKWARKNVVAHPHLVKMDYLRTIGDKNGYKTVALLHPFNENRFDRTIWDSSTLVSFALPYCSYLHKANMKLAEDEKMDVYVVGCGGRGHAYTSEKYIHGWAGLDVWCRGISYFPNLRVHLCVELWGIGPKELWQVELEGHDSHSTIMATPASSSAVDPPKKQLRCYVQFDEITAKLQARIYTHSGDTVMEDLHEYSLDNTQSAFIMEILSKYQNVIWDSVHTQDDSVVLTRRSKDSQIDHLFLPLAPRVNPERFYSKHKAVYANIICAKGASEWNRGVEIQTPYKGYVVMDEPTRLETLITTANLNPTTLYIYDGKIDIHQVDPHEFDISNFQIWEDPATEKDAYLQFLNEGHATTYNLLYHNSVYYNMLHEKF